MSAYTRASGLCLTPKPLRSEYIRVGRRKSFIDLGAEKAIIGAEKKGVKIAVEIKSFLGASDLDEFEDALGQFIIYFNALEEKDPDRHLYMAMPSDFHERFFEDEFFRKLAERYRLKMIIFDEDTKLIRKWTK